MSGGASFEFADEGGAQDDASESGGDLGFVGKEAYESEVRRERLASKESAAGADGEADDDDPNSDYYDSDEFEDDDDEDETVQDPKEASIRAAAGAGATSCDDPATPTAAKA